MPPGRPRKHQTDEERKAAVSRYNKKYEAKIKAAIQTDNTLSSDQSWLKPEDDPLLLTTVQQHLDDMETTLLTSDVSPPPPTESAPAVTDYSINSISTAPLIDSINFTSSTLAVSHQGIEKLSSSLSSPLTSNQVLISSSKDNIIQTKPYLKTPTAMEVIHLEDISDNSGSEVDDYGGWEDIDGFYSRVILSIY